MESGHHFFPTEQLQNLLNSLHDHGYSCIGPRIKDDAIVYSEIDSVTQLPLGISDTQKPGSYSLNVNQGSMYFDWANGPQSLKPLLFPPRETLWKSQRSDNGKIAFSNPEQATRKRAVIGARACDIAALKIHDQHFLQQQFVDPYYKARRENLLVIAVNCSSPADTCFCHSTGDGPFVTAGSDIVLTELTTGFIIDVRTLAGEKILGNLPLQECTSEHYAEADSIKQKASVQNQKLPDVDIKSRLLSELTNDAWHKIAADCLSCGNCTSVCPTCFCHSEQDQPALNGSSSEHSREWDSCFTQGHSYIHGITIRSETSQRYRQWLTHKFSSWHEQYGRSGCVGCGRCTTWCPVGIDVIASIKQIVERRRG